MPDADPQTTREQTSAQTTRIEQLEAALRPFAKAARSRTIRDALSFAPQADVQLQVTRGFDEIKIPASAFAAALKAFS